MIKPTPEEQAKAWWESLGPDGAKHCSDEFTCLEDMDREDDGPYCDICQDIVLDVATSVFKYQETLDAKETES